MRKNLVDVVALIDGSASQSKEVSGVNGSPNGGLNLGSSRWRDADAQLGVGGGPGVE